MSNDLNDLSDIQKMAKVWQLQLNLEYKKPERNVRLSFRDIGPFCEYTALDFLPSGYKGGGSGGMGFDLYSKTDRKAVEVKSCCTIQNAKCNSCGAKFNNLFSNRCPDCGENNYKTIADSRFSINAKETLEQEGKGIFGGFIFTLIALTKNDPENKTLEVSIQWYSLDFEDDEEIKEIRLDYFRNQLRLGKKDTCNLLPNSYDFYKLNPIKIAVGRVTINYDDLNIDPEVIINESKTHDRISEDILSDNEKTTFRMLSTYSNGSADAKDFTKNMPYRKKSLGKDRGDTRANVYRRLG